MKTLTWGIIAVPYLTLTTLLAQSSDPISGGAGWVGAGLLGLVLAWYLFIRTPAIDKQFNDLVKSCDAHNTVITDKYLQDVKEAREFSERMAEKHLTDNRDSRLAYLEDAKDARQKYDSSVRYIMDFHDKQLAKLAPKQSRDVRRNTDDHSREG